MTKKAVLYARVSTDDQKDKGYSLPSQFDAMRKYAAREGFEVVAEFQDDYSGATPIEHRPEGRKAYALLQSGAADVIVAYTIDRFVRPPEDGDEWEMPILIRGLAKLGKEIHTCDIGKLKTDFVSLLLVVIGAKSAGEERRKIRERSMRGKRQKAQSGKVVGTRAPYGYRYERDANGKVTTLVADPETAGIVKMIFHWYVDGDEKGGPMPTRSIARRLSEMKAPTPGDLAKGYDRKHRRAGMWRQSTITQIIDRETYAGKWYFGLLKPTGGKYRGGHPEYKTQRNGEEIAVDVPAIISQQVWQRAQAQRGRNKAMAKRNGRREYLLRGLIKCGVCGSSMCGHYVAKSDTIYYRCAQPIHRYANLDQVCNAGVVRAGAIEADVWNETCELFSDLDRLWDELKRAQASEEDAQKPIREKLDITIELIRRAEGEADKIGRALRDAEEGGAVHKALKRDELDTNAQLKSLAIQREKLAEELMQTKLNDESTEAIMAFARATRKGIEQATAQDKRRILESLAVKVTAKQGRYKIANVLGEAEGEIGASIVNTSCSQMRKGARQGKPC